VDIEASNWLVALGEGLGKLGLVDELSRLACEALPNGRILVRDVVSGNGYAVIPLGREMVEDDPSTEEETLARLAEGDLSGTVGVDDYVESVLGAADADDAIRRALAALRELAPAAAGTVFRRHTDGWLGFEGAFGPTAERLAGVVIPPRTGIAGFVVEHGLSLSLRDAYDDDRFFKQMDSYTGYQTRSLISAPIALDGSVYGCIELINATGPNGFGREAMADMETIARALARRLAVEVVPTPPTGR
jgi:hypothetical protein